MKELPLFIEDRYGPYSRQLIDYLEFFIAIGFIKEEDTDISISQHTELELRNGEYERELVEEYPDYTDTVTYESSYSLDDKGLRFVEERIWPLLSVEQKNILHRFKKKINSTSLGALLYYVYNTYPEWTNKSLIKDRYIHDKGDDNA